MAWVIVAIIVVLAIVAIGWLWARLRRTQQLQDRFGPEYVRAVDEHGDAPAAEQELRQREARREQFDIRPLAPESRMRYLERWKDVQARFVEQPAPAVSEADGLIAEAMRERGYPVDDFDQRAADLSVDYPEVVENYRAGHAIAAAGGRADTEDLRQAMVHYRSLFDRLVESDVVAANAGPER
jgi:predicted nucleic acid-binding protein